MQGDVSVNTGRLRAKVLLFDKQATMRTYWRRYAHHGLGRGFLGAVNALRYSRTDFFTGGGERDTECVDRRYFCMIGLLKGHLTLPVVMHEAVHAGFCFAKRQARSSWDAQALSFDEEAVAYPAGLIAEGLIDLLAKTRHWPTR